MINLTLTRNGKFNVESACRSVTHDGHPVISLIEAKDIAARYASSINDTVCSHVRFEGVTNHGGFFWLTELEALTDAAAIVLSMARNPCADACHLLDLEQQIRQIYRDGQRLHSLAFDAGITLNDDHMSDIKSMLWQVADIAESHNQDVDSYLDAEAILHPYRLQD